MWEKTNWRDKPRVQMPVYQDQKKLSSVEETLGNFPPLVFAGEVRNLKYTSKVPFDDSTHLHENLIRLT